MKEKNLIENVQRRGTKSFAYCEGLQYEDRLKKLDIPCLAYRKLRGDVIEVFKMLNGHYDQDIETPLTRASEIHNREVRGAEHNLRKSKSKGNVRANSFRNRVVPFWNELPTKVKEAPSVKSFESRLDKYWKRYDIKYNFKKCVEYERRRKDPGFAGAGPKLLPMDNNSDLETQAL